MDKEWKNLQEIDKSNEFNYMSVLYCANGKYKTSGGYIWKYKYPKKQKAYDDEEFKNIDIFEDKDYSNYEVSNYGTVKSIKRKLCFKPVNRCNYLAAGLTCKKTKQYNTIYIHRLVAHKFVDGRTDKKNVVNHIDKNKHNNKASNLEWVTTRQNIVHSKGKAVNQIDIKTGEIIKTYDSIMAARRALNLRSDISIRKCCWRIYKTGYGYKWEYA